MLPKGSNVVVDVISPVGDESNKLLAAFVVLPKKHDDADLDVEGKLRGYTISIFGSLLIEVLALELSLLPFLDKEIRLPLQERLPKYMCPSVYIPIAKMPETTSNKADRKALKALGSSKTVHEIAVYTGIERMHAHPVTHQETMMQKFWSEILKLESADISANDNFFVLGGDSIKAIQLIKVAQTASLSISYNDVFKTPKLTDLALKMQKVGDTEVDDIEPFSTLTLSADGEDLLPVIEKAGIDRGDVEDYYMSTAEQDRMIRQTLVRKDSHIIPFPYQLGPEIDLVMFKRAWKRLVAALPIFRTRLVELTPSTSLQVVMKEKIQWQELNSGIEDAKPLIAGFGKPLTSWAISSSKKNGKDKFFIMNCHHALLDGWSLNLLWDALANAYKDDKEPVFKCSMNSLVKFLAGRDHRASELFWASKLNGALPSTFLNIRSNEYIPYQTDRREDKVVFEKFPTSSFTISTIIQVAYAMTIWFFSTTKGAKDVVFRTTGTGRAQEIPGIQELIGPVLTSYPVLIQLTNHEYLTKLLERVQNHASEVVEHEYYGVEQIKKLCKSEYGFACDSNSPYLIVQADVPAKPLRGTIPLPTPWVPSQTPFSVCCILKPDGVKIVTGFDKEVIPPTMVDGFLRIFGSALKTIVELLNKGKDAQVGHVLSDCEYYLLCEDESDEAAEDGNAMMRMHWLGRTRNEEEEE